MLRQSIYLYNILGGRPFHPSKFLILEEEDDGRGRRRRRMAAAAVYPNILYNKVTMSVRLSVEVLKPRSRLSVCRGPETQIPSVRLSRS